MFSESYQGSGPKRPAARGRRISQRFEETMASGAADVLAFLLRLPGKRAYRYMMRALKERQPPAVETRIELVAPNHVDPDPSERPLVERIFESYKRAKRDQTKRDSVFLPIGGWKNVVDRAYASLITSWESNDIDRFHFFLANFGAWHEPTGITEAHKLRSYRHRKQQRLYFEQRVMAEQIAWWQLFESQGRELSALSMPRYGNQSGAMVDGHFVSTDSVASDIDARLLSGICDGKCPRIGELGGGFGRLVYFFSRYTPDFTYIGFDLPECLCCASYYLMHVFPTKRFLLYGESELTPDALEEHDFVMSPSFEIAKLGDEAVDLFLNENSLGMMSPDACTLFVREICRTAKEFWHRNHEARRNPFPDGSTTLINREYPIDGEKFSEVVRYCDIRRFIGPEGWTLENDMFWYYYSSRRPS